MEARVPQDPPSQAREGMVMEKGTRVVATLHYRCKGRVGGWEPVHRYGTVVKENRVTCWVKWDHRDETEKVDKAALRRA